MTIVTRPLPILETVAPNAVNGAVMNPKGLKGALVVVVALLFGVAVVAVAVAAVPKRLKGSQKFWKCSKTLEKCPKNK